MVGQPLQGNRSVGYAQNQTVQVLAVARSSRPTNGLLHDDDRGALLEGLSDEVMPVEARSSQRHKTLTSLDSP
jgi:hypothetical protein